jgi:hypothetical protein
MLMFIKIKCFSSIYHNLHFDLQWKKSKNSKSNYESNSNKLYQFDIDALLQIIIEEEAKNLALMTCEFFHQLPLLI